MRKNILGALIASAFAAGGTAHAGLTLDLNGAAAGGEITAGALDWAPTSFLAQGGNAAIANFVSNAQSNFVNQTNRACGAACNFEVLTHARLSGYSPSAGGGFIGLPAFGGEITFVARYQEAVVGFTGGTFSSAIFSSTGLGSIEFYYSSLVDSDDLTGSGFNNGRLIGRLDGVNAGAIGSFLVTGAPSPAIPASGAIPAVPAVSILLDQSENGNQYGTQQTVKGTGSQETIVAGTTGIDLDPLFFRTLITDFALNFTNVSIALPYLSVDPSDCFNVPDGARAVGSSNLSTCDANHVNGDYAAQGGPGYTPNVGAVNGLGLGSPDFIAQTDFNSSVRGTVPEPGTLALMGLALGSVGFVAARRRRGS